MADAPVLETGPEPAAPQPGCDVDVLIVGAGLSGIGAAWHMRAHCPGVSYAILEARDAIGGTWDLFRYPGIRSDSDMFTLGYIFRPWEDQKAIADGPSIWRYVNDTAKEAGIDRHIRFHHRVTEASFDSGTARWTVTAETPDGPRTFTAPMLLMAAGYYSYENPYNPPIPGEEGFSGTLFHAQHWPQDLDHAGKRVVVIGSGATAVTIVPVVAETAAHVTMLQRSPTWMVSRPSEDRVANLLRKLLPAKAAYALVRWKNIFWQNLVFKSARKDPAKANRRLLELLAKELPEDEIAAHFTPRYNVWEQRLCLVPDSDFFTSVKAGRADVVTDTIDHLDETGIVLASGRRLDADIIVKATGLNLQMMGGARILVDGAAVTLPERYIYRGMMIEGVPNLVYVFGYFNASWTLRADLTSVWFCRLLNEMKARGSEIVVPLKPDATLEEEPRLLTSGYVQRALAVLPKQSTSDPWRDTQDYLADRKSILKGPVGDSVLQFMKAPAPAAAAPASVPEPAE
jgi:monooxygenase